MKGRTKHLSWFDYSFKAIQDVAQTGMSGALDVLQDDLGTEERSNSRVVRICCSDTNNAQILKANSKRT